VTRVRTAVLLAVLVALLILVGTTGTALLPTWAGLGPCLRDWTSPVSYHARVSPLAGLRAPLGSGKILLCYGRPSMHGRTVYGGLVPFGALWRTGANEPTRLSTNRAIILAGILLAPGRYSLYSIPAPDAWEVFVSRSTLHWGNDLSPAVRAEEVGQARLPTLALAAPVETLTIHGEPAGDSLLVQIDWETTRVTLPIKAVP
jgi:Protein of unknown function (DUF2911)